MHTRPRKTELFVDSKLVEIVTAIAEDPNIPFFMDRQFPQTPRSRLGNWLRREYAPKSLLNYWALCFDWSVEFYNEFRLEKPNYLICPSTPHQAKWYVRTKVAEQLGVPVYVIHNSRIPNYYRIYRGLGREPEPIETSGRVGKEYARAAADYIGRCKSAYTCAIPSYEKLRLERNNGQHFRLARLLSDYWDRPSLVVNAWRCWNTLKGRSLKLELAGDRRFAIFYLHYQPERTTLPEGYGFTQQVRAIIHLRAALPADVTLLVKEHPSIFTNKCNAKARDPNFYRVIDRISGVRFIDIQTDNFVLIDRSILTATICGTVNTESLIRGKPTIAFGLAKFHEVLGQHYYRSMHSLREFVHEVMVGAFNHTDVSREVESSIFREAGYVVRFDPKTPSDKKRRIAEDILRNLPCTQSSGQGEPVEAG